MHCLDFHSTELREKFSIVDTINVSAHGYDPYAQAIINENKDGLVLDCGAGSRGDYLPNVVNYEIVDCPSTDVRGVAEARPFRDGVFDGVLCLNVPEHVKDPFCAVREIARVMKPGARLDCVVPFLQPLHAYPHHYYNKTAEGLRNLFTPFAGLIHHESASRGAEDTTEKIRRFQHEIESIKARWGERPLNDPAYNPNLILDSEDFALAYPPRVPPLA